MTTYIAEENPLPQIYLFPIGGARVVDSDRNSIISQCDKKNKYFILFVVLTAKCLHKLCSAFFTETRIMHVHIFIGIGRRRGRCRRPSRALFLKTSAHLKFGREKKLKTASSSFVRLATPYV